MLIILIVCTLIVCLFFTVFFIKSYSGGKGNSSLSTTSAKVNINNYKSGYYLGEYEGKLATYSTESDNPIEVFDVYIASLPSKDVEKIRDGIYANNEAELQRLIEDFTS